MEVKATYSPSALLMLRANATIQRITRDDLWLYIPFSVLPLILILFLWWKGASLSSPAMFGMPSWMLFVSIAIVAPLAFQSMFFVLYWRSLRATPAAQHPQEFSFSPSGFKISTDGANTSFEWKSIVSVHRTASFLLLFFSKKCAYYVPIELLCSDDIETVVRWYEEAK